MEAGRNAQPIRKRSPPSAAALAIQVAPPSPSAVQRGIQTGLTTLTLIMNGYHVFCAAPLYSIPYALMEGGWFGIVVLVVYWFCAFFSSVELGMLMAEFPNHLWNYQEVGDHAYGRTGRVILSVNEHLLALAGCVESVALICQAVVYTYPEFIALLDDQSKWAIILGVIVLIIPLTLICEKANVGKSDQWLTGLGTILNILVVLCLIWLRYVNGVTEHISTTKYVKLSSLPMASGLFGYCFSGHPYLPVLYRSIMTRERDVTYRAILVCVFIPSLMTYLFAACLGYSMFGENVKSVYILNMPLEYRASDVAVVVLVVHQFIRFLLGIHSLEESVYSRLTQNRSAEQNYSRIILKGVIVTIIVPLSILIPAYGPLMAFLGSLLGIVVSLLIPCVCAFRSRWLTMSRAEMIVLVMIILLASFAAIAGMVSSFPQMMEMQWGFVKFSHRS